MVIFLYSFMVVGLEAYLGLHGAKLNTPFTNPLAVVAVGTKAYAGLCQSEHFH